MSIFQVGPIKWSEEDVAFRVLNTLLYAFRRNNWMFDPSRFFRSFSSVSIDRPIFLLGTQGGGLTLISRMLRRNPSVVSVTGGYKYWSGADEMQNVLGPVLPSSLTGIKHKAPPDVVFDVPRGWLYATDRLISAYRSTEADVSLETKRAFRKILKWVIERHSSQEGRARFIDKSQLFTIKVAYIAELLEGCGPRFLLITRNPYAVCYRSVEKAWSLKRLEKDFSFRQRLDLAAQHWANSMLYALEDRSKVEKFKIIRFEDVLREPERRLKEICEFVDLEYNKDMLPQPEHKVPIGSLRRNRWYPLRPEVNEKYLSEMEQEHVDIIAERCKEYAELFDYETPAR
jgi:hypothetical protein